MTQRLVRLDDTAPRPWKNGGGVTRELLAWPAGDDWQVRVSVADIEADGPFSAFPGVERRFVVLQGRGVVLDIDGTLHRCTANGPALCFPGDAATQCRLIAGPTRDLNFMLRGARGRMEPVQSGAAWTAGASSQAGIYALLAGRCVFGSTSIEMTPHTLLWLDPAPSSLAFTAPPGAAAHAGWWLAADRTEGTA